MRPSYYNEINSYAAQWLRNLIAAGHLPAGDVDERSIEDVRPDDLRTYGRCHFFCGIGVWPYALARAGWPEERTVWTGSCPCQPFSAAGRRAGFADERHLWPHFFHLIEQCRPPVVMGEQVASQDGLAWLDLVLADLEGSGYAAGATDTCAAGFGAPHIRQRIYWVADALPTGWPEGRPWAGNGSPAGSSGVGGMADAKQHDCRRETHPADHIGSQTDRSANRACGCGGSFGRMADTGNGSGQRSVPRSTERGLPAPDCENATFRPGPTNGYWRDADWLGCRDGKWRPVEPGAFPLVAGAASRVGRLRAYGNTLCAPQAVEVIRAFLDCAP